MSKISKSELELAFRLLRKATSIQVIQRYLKDRELASSAGSWDELVGTRIEPAVKGGSLDREDIIQMLRDAEEHGRQHVLLFSTHKHIAQQLMNPDRVRELLQKFDLTGLMDSPSIVELPKAQILVDVRVGRAGSQRQLVIKSVDGRVYRRLVSRKTEGNFETLVYETYQQRAVNICRVLESGEIDVRIQSYQRVLNYEEEAEKLLQLCLPLLERMQVHSVPLTAAKMYIARKPVELKDRVRFGNGKFKNRKGGGMTIATGAEQQDLYDDEGAIDGTLAYLKKNDGYCEEASVYWKPKIENALPSTELHTYVAGAFNEFALTSQCTADDFEYVLAQIKKANRRI